MMTVDAREFKAALAEVKAALRKSWPDTVKMEARLYLGEVVKGMLPQKTDKGVTGEPSVMQGRKRVARDVRRVFRSPKGSMGRAEQLIKQPEIQDDFLRGMVDLKLKRRLRDLFDKGDARGVSAVLFNMSKKRLQAERIVKQPDASIHKAARVRGSVPSDTRRYVAYTGKLSALNAYIKTVQARVGMAMASWRASAAAVGLKLPAKVPAGSSEGSYSFTGTDTEVVATMTNRNAAAVDQDKRVEFMSKAVGFRINKMKTRVESILAARLKKHSAK